ncbi:unnamed protein product [Ceratitis capitata]|uniref:(Mediterranean fruit fly) hypothetical protein n=1 Tax=Ceratitis capitata TaxID=7213 RepID=A0A811VA01_CERCA|nr:unnamed protein product [Ceratitis capitata]
MEGSKVQNNRRGKATVFIYHVAGSKNAKIDPAAKKFDQRRTFTAVKQPGIRERIIHILAVRPLSKSDLKSRLMKEGIARGDQTVLTSFLPLIARMEDNLYYLKCHVWDDVNENWPYYTEEERKKVTLSKRFSAASPVTGPNATTTRVTGSNADVKLHQTPSCGTASVSRSKANASSNGLKRLRGDLPTINPKKPRLSGEQRLPESSAKPQVEEYASRPTNHGKQSSFLVVNSVPEPSVPRITSGGLPNLPIIMDFNVQEQKNQHQKLTQIDESCFIRKRTNPGRHSSIHRKINNLTEGGHSDSNVRFLFPNDKVSTNAQASDTRLIQEPIKQTSQANINGRLSEDPLLPRIDEPAESTKYSVDLPVKAPRTVARIHAPKASVSSMMTDAAPPSMYHSKQQQQQREQPELHRSLKDVGTIEFLRFLSCNTEFEKYGDLTAYQMLEKRNPKLTDELPLFNAGDYPPITDEWQLSLTSKFWCLRAEFLATEEHDREFDDVKERFLECCIEIIEEEGLNVERD